MRDLHCPAGKRRCPMLDRSSNGKLWCGGNDKTGQFDPYGMELCPIPKALALRLAADAKAKLRAADASRKIPRCEKHGRFIVGKECPTCKTESWRKKEGLCLAALHHGPGHQSKTYCQVKGRHVVHRATYGSSEQTMEWREKKGKRTFTGFFDEPIPLER